MITYSATLDVSTDTATLLTDLLITERRRRGTGIGTRAATCRTQAILVLRWFREDTGMPALARDAGVSRATGYRYLHEGIDVLAARAPDLRSVLEQGKAAGWSHVVLDGTLIRTDRCCVTNPESGHDLWYSGKHRAHGGNVQVVCDPDGFPVAVSDVQPGSMHDLAAARATGFLAALHVAAARWAYPSWPTRATTVPASASTRRPSSRPAPGARGRTGRRLEPRRPRRHTHPHRPLSDQEPRVRSRPVVLRQAPRPRRQCAGRL